MVNDMDALIAAADALSQTIDNVTGKTWASVATMEDACKVDTALARYRAAREAVRKGTPPAFATSA